MHQLQIIKGIYQGLRACIKPSQQNLRGVQGVLHPNRAQNLGNKVPPNGHQHHQPFQTIILQLRAVRRRMRGFERERNQDVHRGSQQSAEGAQLHLSRQDTEFPEEQRGDSDRREGRPGSGRGSYYLEGHKDVIINNILNHNSSYPQPLVGSSVFSRCYMVAICK